MASTSERLVLSLLLGGALAACGFYFSKLVVRRRFGQPKSLAAARLAAAPRRSLQELRRSHGRWVAVCGTAFDVTEDAFFDAANIYGSWVGHDSTYLLLKLGLAPDAADDAEAVAGYLDGEWPMDGLIYDGEDKETTKRRRELVREWFVCFYSRYEVVVQLSDRYVGAEWDALRADMLPADSGANSGAKCPLGFGAKTVNKVVIRTAEDMKNLRTITFQGRRYDVTDSSLFHPDGGQFAHFVGHDVTYALATQSMRVEDLDVVSEREYTFEEQVLLERYRNFFARELTLLQVDEEKTTTAAVDLHQVVEESDRMTQEECVQCLEKALESVTPEQVNAVCARTTMTPLHKAVEKHRLDLVKVLLSAGADVEMRAALYDDQTPLQMARRFHFDDVVAHLESVPASSN
jgi:hypothetical protein